MKLSGQLRLALLFAILTIGSVFIAVWAVIWAVRGSYLTAAFCLAATTLLVCLLLFVTYPLSGAARPRGEYGPEGTKVRPQKYVDRIFILGLAIGVSAAALYLILSYLDMVDFVPSGSVTQRAVPAGCVFYVIFGAPILYRIARFRDGSHLLLDPHGFEVWDGQWNSFKRGEWDDVEQILDHPPQRKKSSIEVIVFVLSNGRSAKLVSNTITANSNTLREWVRFYWQHPEYRTELTDGRALQRLDEETFVAE